MIRQPQSMEFKRGPIILAQVLRGLRSAREFLGFFLVSHQGFDVMTEVITDFL